MKHLNEIVMVPHKNKLAKMSEEEIQQHRTIVNVKEHNSQHKHHKEVSKGQNPTEALSRIRKQSYRESSDPQAPVNDVESRGAVSRFDRLSPRTTTQEENQSRYSSYDGPDERNFRRW